MMGQPQVHLPVFFTIEQKIIKLAKMAVSGTGTNLKRGLTRKSVTEELAGHISLLRSGAEVGRKYSFLLTGPTNFIDPGLSHR